MKKTILEVPHDRCTGCGACCNICPVHAINMIPDVDGFPVPSIDSEQCVDCGLCLQKCPVVHPVYDNINPPECYAIMASDEIRLNSSSGGFFTLAANWILEQGGVVCGARYSEDCYTVYHTFAETKEALSSLRGSKYVQSDTGDCYKRIKALLKEGRLVLFTGTPCQAAALKSVLGHSYDNLYIIDLVCHGVPSPGLYTQFIKELEKTNQDKIVNVSFRDKTTFGWNPATTIRFVNMPNYLRKRNESPYLAAFLQSLTFRESCGQCKFAAFPRQADLSMADFWDVHRWKQELDDRKGTGVILINNEHGRRLFDAIQQNASICEEAPLDHAIRYNWNINHSSKHHSQRDRFYALIRERGFSVEKAVDWALHKKYDVALVGWWNGENYGSMLTNFALNRAVTDMGKSVLMLEWPGHKPEADTPKKNSRWLADKYYTLSDPLPMEEYWKLNRQAETFLVGSDQLWNWWSNRDIGSTYYFLDFVDGIHKKVAYSTSFGHDSAYYPYSVRRQVSNLLARFDAVSVREESAVKRCRDSFGREDAVVTADPVFLCGVKWYQELAECSHVDIESPYVFAYILNPTKEKNEAIRYQAKKMGIRYVMVLDNQGNFEELHAQTGHDPNVLGEVEIQDWVKYMQNASYVITDSFHGYCFSLIFQKQVCVFPNKMRGYARFNTIGEITQTVSCFAYNMEEARAWMDSGATIDYQKVSEQLEKSKSFGWNWLKNQLDTPKKGYTNAAEVAADQVWYLERENEARKETIHKLEQKLGQADLRIETLKREKEELSQHFYQETLALQEMQRTITNTQTMLDCLQREQELNKYGWIVRKIRGGIQCYKDNGFLYTWKHFLEKLSQTFRKP